MPKHETVLVIGGGVIGGAIGYELKKRGFDVTLVERGDFAGEASTAAAGLLGIQAEIFDGHLPSDLLLASQSLHRRWTEELELVSQLPVQYAQPGMVRVAVSEEEAEGMKRRIDKRMQDTAWLSREEMLELEPLVSDGSFGGVLFPQDAQLQPLGLAKSLYTALLRSGCLVRKWTTVLNVLMDARRRVIGVHTTNGDMFADHVVLAAGAWSTALLSPIGVNLPVVPIKGQAYSVKSHHVPLKRIVQGNGVYIVPKLEGTFLIGATYEEGEWDKAPTAAGIGSLHHRATQLVPSVANAEFVTTWAGLRPGSKDGLPYIGVPSGVEGLLVATGHTATGVMLAPLTAQIIADLICNVTPSVNLQSVNPNR